MLYYYDKLYPVKKSVCCMPIAILFAVVGLAAVPLLGQVKLWQINYADSSGFKSATHIDMTSDGDIIVAGELGAGSFAAHLTKLSIDGVERWSHPVGDEINNVITLSCRETEKGLIRLESFRNLVPGIFSPKAPFVLDLDYSGDMVESHYDAQLNNIVSNTSIFLHDGQNGYRIVSTNLNSDPPIVSIRYLNDNAILQEKIDVAEIGGDSLLILHDAEIQNDGATVVVGSIEKPGSRRAVYLSKISPDGNLVWDRRILPGSDVWIKDLLHLQNGDLLLTGSYYSNSDTKTLSILLMRLTENGEMLWEKVYAVGKMQAANALIESAQNSFLLAGFVGQHDTSGRMLEEGSSDALILHVDENGNLLWYKTIGEKGVDDVLLCAKMINDETIIFGGVGNGDQMLLTTFTFHSTTSIDEKPAPVLSSTVYPNPMQNSAQLEFELAHDATVKLIITNALGRSVYNETIGHFTSGLQRVNLPISELTSGTFFYRLIVLDHYCEGEFVIL